MDSGQARQARIFDWNGSAWVQAGSDINGAAGDQLGSSSAFSDDGQRVFLVPGLEVLVRVMPEFWNGMVRIGSR